MDAQTPLGILSLAKAVESLRSRVRKPIHSSTVTSAGHAVEAANRPIRNPPKIVEWPEQSSKISNTQASLVSPSAAWPQHLCSDV